MNTVCAILVIIAASFCIIYKEVPFLSGVLVQANSTRASVLKAMAVVLITGGMFIPLCGKLAGQLIGPGGILNLEISEIPIFALVVTVFLTYVFLDRLKLFPSLALAFSGAALGFRFAQTDQASIVTGLSVSWVVSLLLSFLISAIIYIVLKWLFDKSGVHLLLLASRMRPVAVVGLALGMVAAGVNQGAILKATASASGSGYVLAAVPIVIALSSDLFVNESYRCAERHYGLSLPEGIAIGYSAALVMLLFSSQALCGLVGLKAAPLSIPALCAASFAGIAAVNKRRSIDIQIVFRSFAGLVLSVSIAFALSLLCTLPLKNGREGLYLAVVMVFIAVIAGIITINYISGQKRRRLDAEKRLAAQQQEIYNNQKALDTMEIKSVLAENQFLHNTLEMKRKELINVALSISEQKEYMNRLADEIYAVSRCQDEVERSRRLSEISSDLKSRNQNDSKIEEFYAQVETLHKDFTIRLEESFPNLTQQEKKLAVLLRLGFSTKYIANLMYITPKTVEIERYRLRQKLGLKRSDNLTNYIKSI